MITIDCTAQIVIEYDETVMTEDFAVNLVGNYLQMPQKFPTKEETILAKSLTVNALDIYDVVECE